MSMATFGRDSKTAPITPERHPSSGHLQAVGQPAGVDRLAHRVGEADDDSQRVGDPVDPRRSEREAVDERVATTGGARPRDILGVGGQHVGLLGAERRRHRLERLVLGVGVQLGELARGAARRRDQVGNARPNGGRRVNGGVDDDLLGQAWALSSNTRLLRCTASAP